MGDVHGDLDATRRALRLAGAIDAADTWIGGKLVVVQTGDQLDRGDDERKILDLFARLRDEAQRAGGEFISLNGNHELMNVGFDFRYVTRAGFDTFADVKPETPDGDARIRGLAEEARGRGAAFAPGGSYAKKLAEQNLFVKVGQHVFVHGGIAPRHVNYGLGKMNREAKDFLLGKAREAPPVVVGEDGPVWLRTYSAAPGREECATLESALTLLGARAMVMGHTVQRGGVSDACDKRAYRIDVGMARYYGGPIQVLEIVGDRVTVLREGGQ